MRKMSLQQPHVGHYALRPEVGPWMGDHPLSLGWDPLRKLEVFNREVGHQTVPQVQPTLPCPSPGPLTPIAQSKQS